LVQVVLVVVAVLLMEMRQLLVHLLQPMVVAVVVDNQVTVEATVVLVALVFVVLLIGLKENKQWHILQR
jgi:hypothetical protein